MVEESVLLYAPEKGDARGSRKLARPLLLSRNLGKLASQTTARQVASFDDAAQLCPQRPTQAAFTDDTGRREATRNLGTSWQRTFRGGVDEPALF